MLRNYIALFLFCGVLGWAIDAFYRSTVAKKWISGTRIPGFSLVYALGGLLLLLIIPMFQHVFWLYKFVGYAIALSALEFVSGIFCKRFMKKTFWEYSKNFLNLKGHTDLLHAVYWGILGLTFELLLYPIFDKFI
jgi:uncharacterized membrane protein